jgi:hypothetical protein
MLWLLEVVELVKVVVALEDIKPEHLPLHHLLDRMQLQLDLVEQE